MQRLLKNALCHKMRRLFKKMRRYHKMPQNMVFSSNCSLYTVVVKDKGSLIFLEKFNILPETLHYVTILVT